MVKNGLKLYVGIFYNKTIRGDFMNKKLIKFLSIGGILVGSTVLSTNYVAKANTTIASVQNYDREEMINYLLSHSVPEEKVEILLKKT